MNIKDRLQCPVATKPRLVQLSENGAWLCKDIESFFKTLMWMQIVKIYNQNCEVDFTLVLKGHIFSLFSFPVYIIAIKITKQLSKKYTSFWFFSTTCFSACIAF